MSAVQFAMMGELPHTAIRDAIVTHPTLAEGLTALFSSASSRPNQAKKFGEGESRAKSATI
jgi:probable pyridine nucleotide-disulfide oxidoreductase